jgi:hypothetical protein
VGVRGVKRGKSGKQSENRAVVRTDSAPTRTRKPYQKPAFQFERIFETMALSCGKMSATQSHCRFNRQNS